MNTFQIGDIVTPSRYHGGWLECAYDALGEVVKINENDLIDVKLLTTIKDSTFGDTEAGYVWHNMYPSDYEFVRHSSGCRFMSLL